MINFSYSINGKFLINLCNTCATQLRSLLKDFIYNIITKTRTIITIGKKEYIREVCNTTRTQHTRSVIT